MEGVFRMNKLTFRAKALDSNKPLQVFVGDDIPDSTDFVTANRTVPEMPTGMEKEEETQHHLQKALISQQSFGSVNRLIIPVPDVKVIDERYKQTYSSRSKFQLPKKFIHVQPSSTDQDVPDYDMDEEDEEWLMSHPLTNQKLLNDPIRFECVMDKLEKSSSHTVISLPEAKALIKEKDDVIIAIYDYWLTKRLKQQTKLQHLIKLERKELAATAAASSSTSAATTSTTLLSSSCIGGGGGSGSSSSNVHSINPYVAFRKRAERMQTRKNRKNDEQSYLKMLKVKDGLLKTMSLLKMLRQREILKKTQVQIKSDLFIKRYEQSDWSGSQLEEAIQKFKSTRPVSRPITIQSTNPYTSSNNRCHNNSNNNLIYNETYGPNIYHNGVNNSNNNNFHKNNSNNSNNNVQSHRPQKNQKSQKNYLKSTHKKHNHTHHHGHYHHHLHHHTFARNTTDNDIHSSDNDSKNDDDDDYVCDRNNNNNNNNNSNSAADKGDVITLTKSLTLFPTSVMDSRQDEDDDEDDVNVDDDDFTGDDNDEVSMDGRFAFRRKKGCLYYDFIPFSSFHSSANDHTSTDNTVFSRCPRQQRNQNFSLVSIDGSHRRIGQLRQRIGRGGRVIWDRSPYEPNEWQSHQSPHRHQPPNPQQQPHRPHVYTRHKQVRSTDNEDVGGHHNSLKREGFLNSDAMDSNFCFSTFLDDYTSDDCNVKVEDVEVDVVSDDKTFFNNFEDGSVSTSDDNCSNMSSLNVITSSSLSSRTARGQQSCPSFLKRKCTSRTGSADSGISSPSLPVSSVSPSLSTYLPQSSSLSSSSSTSSSSTSSSSTSSSSSSSSSSSNKSSSSSLVSRVAMSSDNKCKTINSNIICNHLPHHHHDDNNNNTNNNNNISGDTNNTNNDNKFCDITNHTNVESSYESLNRPQFTESKYLKVNNHKRLKIEEEVSSSGGTKNIRTTSMVTGRQIASLSFKNEKINKVHSNNNNNNINGNNINSNNINSNNINSNNINSNNFNSNNINSNNINSNIINSNNINSNNSNNNNSNHNNKYLLVNDSRYNFIAVLTNEDFLKKNNETISSLDLI